MRQPIYPLSEATRRATKTLLVEPGRIDGLLGASGDREHRSDSPRDVVERLQEVLQVIEGGMQTVVAQAEEIDDEEYRQQARGELIASLICLREIWSRFPEAWRPT